MHVKLNVRGNGACPICESFENCHIQKVIKENLKDFSTDEDPMELVIYSCPKFNEKH